jgi:oligopeptidase A
MTASRDNPLLDLSGLPHFSAVRPEHVTPAVDALLADAHRVIAAVRDAPAAPTWEGFVEPILLATERVNRAWSQVSHLNAVVNTPALRDAYNANLPAITAFYTELGQDEALYARYKAFAGSADFARLGPAQRKVVENELRDFRLAGAELPADRKARFKAIREELANLSAKFDENVLDATDAFALDVEDSGELAGVPEDALQLLAEQAAAAGKKGWRITLKAPSYLPVMLHADDRALRETLYRAYVTRASELGKPEWDNGPLIRRTLELRREAAHLLGMANHAEVSLVPKMARTPDEVFAFLRDLARRAKPFAERDWQALRDFARAELALPELAAWDAAYAAEKLRQKRYAFSEQEVKRYFPEERVLAGLFRVVETIFGVGIRESKAETWHPAVRFFDVTDRAGQTIGQFYLDLHARQAKRGGAWMDDAIQRCVKAGRVQTPVAYLTCNFSAPVGGRPALFTHDEVKTLFHEFGHGLHLLLTRVDTLGVSGLGGVEWDAVELPSQFMENFCWEWDVLQGMTAHVDTGAPLPRELYERMLAARNFQSGMQTVRQLELALFDMRLHTDFDPQAGSVLGVLDEVRREVAVVFPPPYNRFPMSFGHIFAGGYAAGYYSYKWAEVLSADAYGLFEEVGVLSAEAGARFRDEVLARGGSRPAMENFVAFRGRTPQIDALLRHSGMAAGA